ncbi:MAG: hypothetical protein AAFX76_10035 [Planctomycetota bacterium]
MRIFLLIWIAVAAGGCVSALPPSVEVVGAEVIERSPEGARLEVSLVLSNPNDFTLPLPEASYTLNVAGTDGFAYVDLPSRVLGPEDAQAIRLPAAVSTRDELSGRRWRIIGSITFEPQNPLRRFLTESAVPLPVVLFAGNGELR